MKILTYTLVLTLFMSLSAHAGKHVVTTSQKPSQFIVSNQVALFHQVATDFQLYSDYRRGLVIQARYQE